MAQFQKNSARRIAEATRRVEATPRSLVKGTSPPRLSAGAKYAIVTTAITAAVRSTSTLGRGVGTLQLVSYDSSDNATYTSTGQSVFLYSGAVAGTGVPIAVDRLVLVDFVDGRYHVVVDYC
jgi:hypothetical protein